MPPRSHCYVLEGHTPVAVDTMTWALWFNKAGRYVAHDEPSPGVEVSTVFLGLDHNHAEEGPPILFETMIFGGEHNESQWRYATWDEAEAGHKAVVEMLALEAGGQVEVKSVPEVAALLAARTRWERLLGED